MSVCSEKMAGEPMRNSTTSQLLTIPAKVDHLLSVLMRVGWNDLYRAYIAQENSTDVDADLLDWIMRGDMDEKCCDENSREFRAWSAIQRESQLNVLLHFLRMSNGDVNFADRAGQTILHVFLRSCLDGLSRRSALRVVEKLMERGALVDAVDENDYTPLHIVAERGDEALMRVILSSFNNVSAASGFHEDTVLHDVVYACNKHASSREHRYVDIVRALLAKGADPNAKNRYGTAPIQLAVSYHFFEILQIFQANGADLHQRTSDDETLLHLACRDGKNPSKQLKIIDLLASQGCDVNARGSYNGYSPLHLAAKLRWPKVVERLVQLGADVNSRTTKLHVTPLHVAASSNQPGNVEILLRSGARVDAEATNAVTALHVAASTDGIKIARRLIEFGADVRKREETFGFTPLHIAAWSGKKKVELLLKKGADANASSRSGVSPLHLASLIGDAKIVKVLIERGVDVHCRENAFALTALHLATMNAQTIDMKTLLFGDRDLRGNCLFGILKWISMDSAGKIAVVELLINNGIDVNVKDVMGRTPLHVATLQTTSGDMIEALLKLGAHIDDNDDECRTPLRNVLENRTVAGLKCLLEFGIDVNDDEAVKEIDGNENLQIVDCLRDHAMKLKTLGLPIRSEYNYSTNEQKAQLEVELLKSRTIGGSDVSLYDFLHMKPRRRVAFVERVLIMSLESEFPEYCSVIKASCRQAVDRVSLLEPAISALNRITHTWWPEICAERIISYVDNRNLRALIASADV